MNNVFVVYGHNEAMRTNFTKYIRRIGINSLDLMEYSPGGIRTIFDALNSCASSVECAIILLSADDMVLYDRHEFQAYRARQNVIFEMGFFAGILGRDKVIVLYQPNEKFEFPSDILGIYYTAYSDDNKWKQELKSHLKKLVSRWISKHFLWLSAFVSKVSFHPQGRAGACPRRAVGSYEFAGTNANTKHFTAGGGKL